MIAFAALSAVCCAGGLFAARLYHWRQDVLYGPYIAADEPRARRTRPGFQPVNWKGE
jgi:hypothetical protein